MASVNRISEPDQRSLTRHGPRPRVRLSNTGPASRGRSTVHLDTHQHAWPDALVEDLRRRSRPPRLDGWTLLTSGEPPFAVNPADHDDTQRARQAACDGIGLAVIGLSSPLGIEYLAPEDADRLLDAYHRGVAALGTPFAGWAAACLAEI